MVACCPYCGHAGVKDTGRHFFLEYGNYFDSCGCYEAEGYVELFLCPACGRYIADLSQWDFPA